MKNLLLALVLVIGSMICAAIICVIVAPDNMANTPAVNTNTTPIVPVEVVTPIIVDTTMPTNVPLPTDTPIPLPTDTPRKTWTCVELQNMWDGMTSLQRDNFNKEVAGDTILFSGTVTNVDDNGQVQLDGCFGFGSATFLDNIPKESAALISKGQSISGIATIKSVDTFIMDLLSLSVISWQ